MKGISFCSLLLLIMFTFQHAYSQVTIKGVVKSGKSKPLYGVSISLKDSYDGATTDSSGKFSFQTTEKGDHVLVASAIGYKPFEQNIKIQPGIESFTIVMKEEITE